MADKDDETGYINVPDSTSSGNPSFSSDTFINPNTEPVSSLTFTSSTDNIGTWNELFSAIQNQTVGTTWNDGSFNNDSAPFIRYSDDKVLYLRKSGIQNYDDIISGDSAITLERKDEFGRTFIWYSAFNIEFNSTTPSSFFRDPGVLVVNPNNETVNVSSTTIQQDSQNGSLESVTFGYSANGNNLKSEYNKIIYFIDEDNPWIVLEPDDNSSNFATSETSGFYLIEAGVDTLTDSRTEGFYYWSGGTDALPSDAKSNQTYELIISANDLIDQGLTGQISTRAYEVPNYVDEFNQWGGGNYATGSDINKIFKVTYDVQDGLIYQDSEPGRRNSAETRERFFVVKDTLPPVINEIM